MKKKRYIDPFFPNRPVDDPLKFSGREQQVEDVVDALFQTANNNPRHIIITGDRGIGKSSLLYQTKLLSAGDNRLVEKFNVDIGVEEKFDFITAWHDADQGQNIYNVVYGLLNDLQNKLSKLFGKFKFELDIAGILKITQSEESEKSIADLVNIFINQIEVANKEVSKKAKNGILLFIDEIDRVPAGSGIATFLKLSTEKLSREGLKNVGFVCAGITCAIQNLEKDHASILRTFRDVAIPRLGLEDASSILGLGFDTVKYTYDSEVLKSSYAIANGFPEPIHLLGSEMLFVTEDNHIDMIDFERAKKKLITDIRKNELSTLLKKAGYGKFQQILKAMSEYDNPYVPLTYISEKINAAQNEYSSNINTLITREIITRVDKGVYCFVNPLLKEYIRNFGIIDFTPKENDEN